MSADHLNLPDAQAEALRRAIRFEWYTLAFLAVAITAVALVMGSSQAMKAAWIEDLLSLAPPLAFLIAIRMIRKPPSAKYPYGFFRSVGVGHLVAGVALFVMGAFLLFDSALGLIRGERPPIGSVTLFGHQVWSGWLMMGVMALTIPLPIYFGHVKMKLARELHNKVLYADADMNKADWMTAAATIVGVGGIALGWWWMDAVAATFVSISILWDGFKNTRAAITDLMDTRATTFDDENPHPDALKLADHLQRLPWVKEAGVRVRDQGQFFHVEGFVVPQKGHTPTLEELSRAQRECSDLDWKLHDVVVIPVARISDHLTVPRVAASEDSSKEKPARASHSESA